MRAEDDLVKAEALTSSEMESYDWSQTPLGAIATWSDDLKTAVQRRFTELAQAEPSSMTAEKLALPQHRANSVLLQVAQADTFRVRLMEALRPLRDATEIQEIAARILGETLGATRVIYIEVASDGKEVIVHRNYTNGVAQLSGRYRLEDYRRNLTADHWAERTQIVTDIPNSPDYTEAEKARYGEIDIAAHVDVPLIKNNQFVALLAAQQSTPRQWTETEIKLVEETAEQTWAAVERARAEAALRESEERYRLLFESIDEGFCVIEVLFDAAGTPVDHHILQANPAFERQTGITNPEGKVASELTPGLEQYWTDLYAQVIHLGESIRLESCSDALNRWFDVLVSRVGDAALRQVAVVFSDISERKRVEDERKRAEAALRQSEQRFRLMADAVPQIVWITDAEGRVEFFNKQWSDYTGVAYEPTTAAAVAASSVHPEDGDRTMAAFNKARCTGGVFSVEHRIRSAAGTYRWFLARAEPYRDPQTGEIVHWFGTSTDIHERKQSAEELRLTHDRLAFVLDTTGIGCWLNPLPLGRLNWDNRTRELFFIPPDVEPTIELFWSRVHPDDREPTRLAVEAALQQRTLYAVDHRAVNPDTGEIRWIRSAGKATYAADGAPIRFDGINYDISDRKQAEAELREREDELREAQRLGNIGNWVWDAKTDASTGSDQLLRIYGLDPEIDTLPTFSEQNGTLYPLESWQRIHEAVKRTLATGVGYNLDVQALRQGELIWITTRSEVVRDATGAIVGLRGTVHEITERKQAELERERLLTAEQQAREEAQVANRIKDEFLAVLSHELRSPLNPILGWTRLLQTGKLDPARQAEALKTIERNAKLQTQLIEDLLDISRIMQGKFALNVAPVRLTFVISAAVETVQLAAEAKNIQITLDLDPSVALVSGDAARLQQMVWNLLTNAVKFTPNNGQVTVELRQIDRLAQIRVIDTGKGISPQFLPHVFEYFRQEDSSTTRQFGGLGLGLAIVRQIVELHGGRVGAASEGENQGATFIVQLPTTQKIAEIASEPIQPQTEVGNLLAGIQILLVDDELDTRDFQAFLLEQSGAIVTAVASGFEALQALAQFTPDVLVSDIGMAGMDGYMLLQQIRGQEASQSNSFNPGRTIPAFSEAVLPAIALTAYATEVDQQRALQVGFQAHLAKPVEPEELVRAIANVLKRS